MTALLTDNLPLLAGAPNGIKKLRELILELAVRGKLVPQDPNDEPASELLKRIAEEKARLVAEGKIKKQKPSPAIDEDEVPFSLPSQWLWGRLTDCSKQVTDGEHLTPPRTPDTSQIPLVTAKNVRDGYMDYAQTDYVSREVAEKCWGRCRPEQGDIMVVSVGATLGRLTVIPTDQEMVIVRSVTLVKPLLASAEFLALALKSPFSQSSIWAGVKQSAQPCLYLSQSSQLLVPIPPLPEQHRIVAKVDELMDLCDRLEARQADAESAHAQLVQALLDSLTQARDAGDFAQSWQRLAEHFHTLFTTESSIDALKQTLLQLAVMGKLVPQDPNDEPASELLKRIAKKKAQLVVEGKIKKQKPLTEVTEAEKPFALPDSWAWIRLEEIAQVGTGATPLRTNPKYFDPATVNWVTSGETSQDLIRTTEQKVSPLALTETNLTVYPPHTLIIAMYGQGKTRGQISELLIDACTNQACAAIQLFAPNESHRHYVKYFFVKSYEDLRMLAAGGAQPNLNLGKIKESAIPLPPLAEQHRIVAKVDQLMVLCDQLKARLNQAHQMHEQLANTLVERALVEDRQQAPVATDRKVARSLLAAEITHQLHGQRTFGQRKLQKVIYLAEHAARLAAIQGSYLRNVAGPHDRQLMSQVEDELHNRQWYQRIERDTIGHAYHPLAAAGQHRQEYESAWPAAERATIQQVIDLMRGWDTDRCERVVTLYAAWNDFLLEGKAVTDEALVAEVIYSWNDAKLRFTQAQWLAELSEMKKHELLTPSGFGKRTQGGLQTLPGLH